MNTERFANFHFARLALNSYPGRLIVQGVDLSGMNLVQVYAIMGRSANSRNRVLSDDKSGRVYTEPADPAKMDEEQRKLTIYNAMKPKGPWHVVSNGDQTDTVVESEHDCLLDALTLREYEPDKPNYTPRITGQCAWSNGAATMEFSLLRKSPTSDSCDQAFYRYKKVTPGYGYGIHTYMGDGAMSLPPFQGEPILLPLFMGGIVDITETYWDMLNPEHRVSLVVKFISVGGGVPQVLIRNKYDHHQ